VRIQVSGNAVLAVSLPVTHDLEMAFFLLNTLAMGYANNDWGWLAFIPR
jgi:hypothetical protein